MGGGSLSHPGLRRGQFHSLPYRESRWRVSCWNIFSGRGKPREETKLNRPLPNPRIYFVMFPLRLSVLHFAYCHEERDEPLSQTAFAFYCLYVSVMVNCRSATTLELYEGIYSCSC